MERNKEGLGILKQNKKPAADSITKKNNRGSICGKQFLLMTEEGTLSSLSHSLPSVATCQFREVGVDIRREKK